MHLHMKSLVYFFKQQLQLWQDLVSILAQHVLGPWVVLGDFNCVLGAHEKRGGGPPNASSCNEFLQMCDTCELLDIPTKGLSFTWSSRRTEVRLDRAIGNLDWIEAWPSLECCTLTKATSDHCPILLSCSWLSLVAKLPFRFQSLWLHIPGFGDLVKTYWSQFNFYGCPQFVLASKLRALKVLLKDWNRSQVGDVHSRVTTSRAALDDV